MTGVYRALTEIRDQGHVLAQRAVGEDDALPVVGPAVLVDPPRREAHELPGSPSRPRLEDPEAVLPAKTAMQDDLVAVGGPRMAQDAAVRKASQLLGGL